MTVQLYHGDCLEVMASMEPNSVDAIVTDPPYGLAFMGKDWDHGVPGVEFWREALRVAKPGAHLVAFGGTRTFHRLAVAIEDAGWELRDTIGNAHSGDCPWLLAWVYGSGFPKSHDVSKAIDKAAGAEPILTGEIKRASIQRNGNGETWKAGAFASHPEHTKRVPITAPATPEAAQWAGWGTALKPAWEPIIVARKPLQGTVAANVLAWGTGGINVDGCRVGDNAGWSYPNGRGGEGWHGRESLSRNLTEPMQATQGRWPANVTHDGSDEVLAGFPSLHGAGHARNAIREADKTGMFGFAGDGHRIGDTSSAARFFYVAKASKADRDEGLEGLPLRGKNEVYGNGLNTATKLDPALHTAESVAARPQRRNHHPTVKPTALMRWLVRLITPPGGVVLDPFAGSGSTGKAAVLEGASFIGIEQDAEYIEIARRRIAFVALPLLEVTA